MGHSTDDNEEINKIFKDAGADHILPKPSKLNQVKDLLESIFWLFFKNNLHFSIFNKIL